MHTDGALDISDGLAQGVSAKFTYSARWAPVPTSYEDRLARYEKLPLDPVHLEVSLFFIMVFCVF